MSLINLKGDFNQIKQKLPDLLAAYDLDINKSVGKLSMVGKTAGQALRDQPNDSAYYAMRKAEVNKLVKFMELQIDACRSRLFRKYTDVPSKELSDRTKDKYIDNEQEYLELYEILLEIKEVHEKFDAICTAFDRRGFALRDWTSLRVHEMESYVI